MSAAGPKSLHWLGASGWRTGSRRTQVGIDIRPTSVSLTFPVAAVGLVVKIAAQREEQSGSCR